ncbi:LacI family DNA-binding transcriptional regulator [Sinomonas gamaensis]|uniref:LacI family DNA-binding transcriptional regulator n=1 Tax=Sinomonas gamaensis TaxID=2565624 RepID=UPI0020168B9B|nr:LacI family DNA-binding transcriptional regulator [Sinomonas gamaensis]
MPANGGRTPSMKDVARLAGVSLGTVSHALNKPEKVSERSLAKVRAAVEQLGFVPNSAARSLAAGASRTVGLVLTDIDNSLFVDIARGAEDQARRAAHALLLANSDIDFNRQESYLDIFDEARVAGILFAPMNASLEGVDRVRRHGRRVVLVNLAQGRKDCCAVISDEELGGYMAARHLIELGRRRLLFAGGPEEFYAIKERRNGALRAVLEAGDVTLEIINCRRLKSDEGRKIAAEIANRSPERIPDGILSPSDRIAAGVIHELMARSFSVPDDIAVIGYDNNQFTTEAAISMSTVSQDGHRMGSEAMRLLLDEIENPDHQHRTLTLEPRLILRESTLGPRGKPLPDTDGRAPAPA